ncbi:hypothetical protein [Formosa sp. PL04]|uniref:hypothetical protein n=1 Tax=Formosa sp. PL04 TaxID=3081755 RepID=UPI002980C6E7|nr:hypothetical protein [Formosa sp. PL04]MDW5287602.1 hypothetical protein [Formosa sp. PL04]
MKRILISVVILLLGFQSLKAQMSSKKTTIEFSNTQTPQVNNIYSVHEDIHAEANYVITKSKIEVPITYETDINYPYENNSEDQIDTITLYSKFSDQGLTSLQSFAVFTVVNTNDLPYNETLENTYTLSPEFKKHLPEGFNPYNGMFEDVNSKSLQHPITAR